MNDVEEWYNNFLEYMQRDAQSMNARRQHIQNVLSQIVKPGMKVLEPGCGIGLNSYYMADKLKAKVYAIDIAPVLIENAQQHKNIIYECADFARWNPEGARYDVGVLCDVLEHVPLDNVFPFIENVCFTVPGGPIYVNIPNAEYQVYIHENAPQLQQIIDEIITCDDVLTWFAMNDFYPAYMNIYGIDAPYQYQEYVFIHRDEMQKSINNKLKFKKST